MRNAMSKFAVKETISYEVYENIFKAGRVLVAVCSKLETAQEIAKLLEDAYWSGIDEKIDKHENPGRTKT